MFRKPCLAVLVFATACVMGGTANAEPPFVERQPDAEADVILRGAATVIDGDTLEVDGVKVRLHGIDAPELKQPCWKSDGTEWPCGEVAAQVLGRLITRGTGEVECLHIDDDRYGRFVAVCWAMKEGQPHSLTVEEMERRLAGESVAEKVSNLNADMVRLGYAMVYRRYSRRYVPYERTARQNRLGIWDGRVEPPWEWRRRGRKRAI